MFKLYLFLVLLSVPVVVSHAQDFSESSAYEPRIISKPKKNGSKAKQVSNSVTASKTRELTIPLSFLTKNAEVVTGIGTNDLNVFVNDQEMKIISLEPANAPLTIALVLDMSPSAEKQNAMVKQLALRFVEKLRPNDSVVLISFNRATKIALGKTSDRKQIAKEIERLKMDEGTAIYDAIREIFEKKANGNISFDAMLIFTDGVDTVSRKATYESSLLEAEKALVPVFPVYFDTFNDNQNSVVNVPGIGAVRFPPSPPPRKEDYELARDYLIDLSSLSGGRPVQASKILSGDVIAFDTIALELGSRYFLTLALPEPRNSGDRYRIRVRVNRPNLLVRVKPSFIEQ